MVTDEISSISIPQDFTDVIKILEKRCINNYKAILLQRLIDEHIEFRISSTQNTKIEAAIEGANIVSY
jgi:methyltransferase-like protein